MVEPSDGGRRIEVIVRDGRQSKVVSALSFHGANDVRYEAESYEALGFYMAKVLKPKTCYFLSKGSTRFNGLCEARSAFCVDEKKILTRNGFSGPVTNTRCRRINA